MTNTLMRTPVEKLNIPPGVRRDWQHMEAGFSLNLYVSCLLGTERYEMPNFNVRWFVRNEHGLGRIVEGISEHVALQVLVRKLPNYSGDFEVMYPLLMVATLPWSLRYDIEAGEHIATAGRFDARAFPPVLALCRAWIMWREA